MEPPVRVERSAHSVGDGRVGRLDLDLDLLRRHCGVPGRGLELGERTVDCVTLVRTTHLSQGAKSHDQRDRLLGIQAQRTCQVVGVVEMDDSLAVKGFHVDLDQVAGHGPWQAAVPQHLQVAHDGGRGNAEVGCHLLDVNTLALL